MKLKLYLDQFLIDQLDISFLRSIHLYDFIKHLIDIQKQSNLLTDAIFLIVQDEGEWDHVIYVFMFQGFIIWFHIQEDVIFRW